MDEMKPMQLLKKGAEADLYLADWHGRKVVFKKRRPKKYRQANLDAQIRTYRTIHEPQLMNEAKKAGVPTPTIFLVDVKNAFIVMKYVEGKQVKQLLYHFSRDKRKQLCFMIGREIAKLHRFGLTHGDLTTSNMIMNSEGKIFFVDFGLGEKNDEVEARGVDLHLMKRALQSTHYQFAEDCFESVIEGYGSISDAKILKSVLRKIEEIEMRGRYVTERKQKEASA
jgi:TP53 regulating kinase-like protein